MTTAVLSAGDGYKYYLQSIAAGDEAQAASSPLIDYYARSGNPQGVWVGGGTGLLGVSGKVTEPQMRALFGLGLHPDADAITAQMREERRPSPEIEQAVKLGRGYYLYDVKPTTLKDAITDAAREYERITGNRPDRAERRKIRMREGAKAFRDLHGRQPLDSEELAKYINNALKPQQHPVAGFDHTFSAPKSVSVLWALADRGTADALEGAHTRAIERTLRDLESEALATRAGRNGIRQIDVQGGIIATQFRHFESRAGDPHLHDHVVIANKVQGDDGRWRTIDSKLLLRSGVTLSEAYNKYLFDELDQLGYRATPRTIVPGKPPILDIDGVDTALVDLFSKRRQASTSYYDELVAEYVQENGHAPDVAARRKIANTAATETRARKTGSRSRQQIHNDVHDEARTTGHATAVDRIATSHAIDNIRSTTATGPDLQQPPIDVHELAATVMRNVEEARTTWGYNHVKAEIHRQTSAHRYRRFSTAEAGSYRVLTRDQAEAEVLRIALDLDSIRVTPEPIHRRFEPLTRKTHSEIRDQASDSLYVPLGRTLYTSTRVIDAEISLLTAARTTAEGPAPVDAETFQLALESMPNKDLAQVHLAREFVTSRAQLVAGVGPAGAGKTSRTLRLASHALNLAGRRMIGLTPSKKAAKVFTEEVHVPARTIDAFLTAHRGAAAENKPVPERYAIRPGDVVIIDEASMSSLPQLADATRIILDAGGFVRPLGDHNQLSAPGAGGAFRLIVKEAGAVALENVYRFSDKHEREASLVLRESDPTVDPFSWYKQHGRIIAAPRERIAELVFRDYQEDVAAGRASLMGAATHEYIDDLNSLAQSFAIADGIVTPDRYTARLADDQLVHPGDRILTRRNNPRLTMNQGRDSVDNGDLYTVSAVHKDGSVTATHLEHGGTITLPADYVKHHTTLGYAYTAHGSQGVTIGGVDPLGQYIQGASRGIVNAKTSRAAAYVLASRATDLNVLYVEIEPGQHPDEVLAQIARNLDTNLSAHETLARETDRQLHLPTLATEHADIVDHANAARFEALATRTLDPHDAAALIESDGWGAAATFLARAEKHGLDPADVLQTTWTQRDFGDADDIGAVMSWRIEKHLGVLEQQGALAPLPAPGADNGRYEWAIDRDTQVHPDIPDTYRDHLAERSGYFDQRMTARGVELTIDKPVWADALGPIPNNHKHLKKWMSLAAEIDLFRATYNIPDTEPTPIPEKFQERELGRNLAARVAKMHKTTAIREHAGTHQDVDLTKQVAKYEQATETMEQQRPRADAETIAHTLDPDRATARERTMERLRKIRDDSTARNEESRTETQDETPQQEDPYYLDPQTELHEQQRGPRI